MADSSLTFRTATATDADRVADLHARSWRENYRGMLPDDYLRDRVGEERRRSWRERYRSDLVLHTILAEMDGQLVGFVCLLPNRDAHGHLVDNLHVSADQRGRGLGAELLARAGRYADAIHPGAPLYLYVLEGNEAALRFYRREGGSVDPEPVTTRGGPLDGTQAWRVTWPEGYFTKK